MVLPHPPLPKRRVVLAAGDVAEYDYVMPDVEPPSGDEDYPLYIKTVAAKQSRTDIDKQRHVARTDFLLSMCVNVKDGPISITDESWVQSLEAAFVDYGYRLSKHPGARKLAFIKYVVITSKEDRDWILESATYAEVSMPGIASAMIGYKTMWNDIPLTDILGQDNSKGNVQFDVRYYEADAAEAHGLALDDTWYSLPVVVREHMIALRLIRTAVENLSTRQAIENAKSHSR